MHESFLQFPLIPRIIGLTVSCNSRKFAKRFEEQRIRIISDNLISETIRDYFLAPNLLKIEYFPLNIYHTFYDRAFQELTREKLKCKLTPAVMSAYMPNRDELISRLKKYFTEKADAFSVDMAFLYGSWARGFPKKESDIDLAIVFSASLPEDIILRTATDISVEFSLEIKRSVNVLPIYLDFRKPMLYYNAIILGEALFIRDLIKYAAVKNEAIFRMEDFSYPGVKWQLDAAQRNLEEVRHG